MQELKTTKNTQSYHKEEHMQGENNRLKVN